MSSLWIDFVDATRRMSGTRYRTRVIEQGSGPAVIMLHGTGGHAEAFSRNFKRMSRDFHLYAIDLLWHGQSAQIPFTGKTLECWVDQVIDFMDTEGIETATIEGESLGGWVGIFLAVAHPSRVASLVLNTTGGVKLPEQYLTDADFESLRACSAAAIQHPTADNVRKRLEWLMASPDRVTDELVELRLHYYSDPAVQVGLGHVYDTQFDPAFRFAHELDKDQLKALECPSLVLWTDKNPHRDAAAGREIAASIPRSEFYLMKDAAHWPQWEKPEEHDRVVMDFIHRALASRLAT